MFVNKSVDGTVLEVAGYTIKVVTVQKPQVLLNINGKTRIGVIGSTIIYPEGIIHIMGFHTARRVYIGLDFPKDCKIKVSSRHARIKSETESHPTTTFAGCPSG